MSTCTWITHVSARPGIPARTASWMWTRVRVAPAITKRLVTIYPLVCSTVTAHLGSEVRRASIGPVRATLVQAIARAQISVARASRATACQGSRGHLARSTSMTVPACPVKMAVPVTTSLAALSATVRPDTLDLTAPSTSTSVMRQLASMMALALI